MLHPPKKDISIDFSNHSIRLGEGSSVLMTVTYVKHELRLLGNSRRTHENLTISRHLSSRLVTSTHAIPIDELHNLQQ